MKKISLIILSLFFMLNTSATPIPAPTEIEFRSLFIGPNGELLVHAGFGVYRSTDDGLKWKEVLKDAGIVLLKQKSDFLSIGLSRSIYRSRDFGITWTHDGQLADVPWVEQMFHASSAYTSIDENGIYYICVDNRALQISSDGGKNWRHAQEIKQCNAVAANKDVAYVVANDGLYKSLDAGIRWTQVRQVSGEMQSLFSRGRVHDLKIDSQGKLYAFGHESLDGGINWYRQNFGLPQDILANVADVKNRVVYITAANNSLSRELNSYISVKGNSAKKIDFHHTKNGILSVKENGEIYITADGNIYKSIDEGSSWRRLTKFGIK